MVKVQNRLIGEMVNTDIYQEDDAMFVDQNQSLDKLSNIEH